ncbi:MAG: tetratricopeptide repeat protein [Betaproteobacteria bacterium]|nr:MAG: tetratricopeptide repeat protein [Betaproteobacteria bacterium]
MRSSPTSARARGLQARFKAEAGDFDGALALLNEILDKAPDNVDAWQLKGDLLYVVKKDVAGALDAHRNALKARPDLVASHASILSILVTQKDLAGAKRQLDDLKKVAPNHLETKYFEAELALLNNDFKTAKEISQQLLKVAPENVKILQLAGAVEYQSGSILQAKHLLGRALQIAPNMAATRRLLARAYLRSGQPSEALDQLAPLLQAAEPGAETLALAAEAYLHNGDPGNAEAYFERAAKLNPNDTRSRTALALGQLSRGSTEAGFSQLEEIAASDKGTVADQALIASRLRQSDYAGALKAIEGFERKQPNTALAANLRGRIQLTQKDLPGARQSFERALAIDPWTSRKRNPSRRASASTRFFAPIRAISTRCWRSPDCVPTPEPARKR